MNECSNYNTFQFKIICFVFFQHKCCSNYTVLIVFVFANDNIKLRVKTDVNVLNVIEVV